MAFDSSRHRQWKQTITVVAIDKKCFHVTFYRHQLFDFPHNLQTQAIWFSTSTKEEIQYKFNKLTILYILKKKHCKFREDGTLSIAFVSQI